MTIERFVRDISYYDFDNKEVIDLKRGKSLEEKMYIMEQRVEELKSRNPESAEKLKNKKHAGVCADFALTTATLLRKAGFLSGVVSGFKPEGKTARIKHAHGTAFVVWPDENGRNKIFSVDGTPDGLEGISRTSLLENEKQAQEKIEEIKKEAEEKLNEIMKVLESQDPEEIRKLTNGELEKVLNNVLKYEVKMSHLQTINRVLEAYWYTPIKDAEVEEANSFLSKEIESQRKEIENNPEIVEQPAGAYLFETIESFVNRFIKGKKTENLEQSFDLIEGIFKTVEKELQPAEKRSLAAIVTYLRAKKMMGKS